MDSRIISPLFIAVVAYKISSPTLRGVNEV